MQNSPVVRQVATLATPGNSVARDRGGVDPHPGEALLRLADGLLLAHVVAKCYREQLAFLGPWCRVARDTQGYVHEIRRKIAVENHTPGRVRHHSGTTLANGTITSSMLRSE